MAFRVEITPRAREDLDKIYMKVTAEAPSQGARWFLRLEQAILSLSDESERCMVEPKLSSSKRVVRKLLFGKRRYVLRIYFAFVR